MEIEDSISSFAEQIGIRQAWLDEFQTACAQVAKMQERPAKYCLPPLMRYGETRRETPIYIKGQTEDLVLIAQRVRWFMGRHIDKARIQSPILHLGSQGNQIIDHGYGKVIPLAGLQRVQYVTLHKRAPVLEAMA